MKKLILLFGICLVLFTCGKDSDEPAPNLNTDQKFDLVVSATEGGSVDTSGGSYDSNSSVTIKASPSDGYQFTGWSGNATGSTNPLTLTVNGNKNITANFSVIKYSLTVSASNGGSVNLSEGEYASQTSINLIASPNKGYSFVRWSGSVSSTQNSIDVVMDNNKIISAVFEESVDVNEGNESIIEYSFNEIDLEEPPFDGTIFITGDIIISSDSSLFGEIEYKGTGARQMYDRRNGGAWINIEPYLFDTSFSDGLKTEIQINPEFTLDEATVEANKYAFLIGQLPTVLRKGVQTMWIHKGEEAYGGGNNNLLVHTGMSKVYENWWTGNIIEETLIHESTHTSIDAYHYPDRETEGAAWIDVVSKDDGCYISSYARDYPYREDLAELMPLYVAVRYFPDRISSDIRDKILSCNFNRIKYLDSLELDMSLYEN
jgi:uncharacterized repeat protein (TIGR02543 family)